MAHLNLQSMNNKADLVKYYVKELGFDLFTFCESWLNPILRSSLFAISGYDLVRLDRSWVDKNNRQKSGGGVGAFIKSSVGYSTHNLAEFNCSTQEMESQWIHILKTNQKTMIVGILYRPPNASTLKFSELLTEKVNSIMGRFNANADIFIYFFFISFIYTDHIRHEACLPWGQLYNTGLQ